MRFYLFGFLINHKLNPYFLGNSFSFDCTIALKVPDSDAGHTGEKAGVAMHKAGIRCCL